jgi:hypothetical protein
MEDDGQDNQDYYFDDSVSVAEVAQPATGSPIASPKAQRKAICRLQKESNATQEQYAFTMQHHYQH